MAESCHRCLNALGLNGIDVAAVAMFTGCWCSEAAPVPPSSLFISHYLTSPGSVCDLTRTFIYATFSACHWCFSSALTVLFLLTCQFPSPSPPSRSPPLSVSPARALLVNRTRARSRNRAACQLDERGHAGPADLAMLSHRKAPPPPRLSFTRTYKVCSVKSHSPHTSHSIVQL